MQRAIAKELININRLSRIVNISAIFLTIQSVAWYYLTTMTFFVFNSGMKPPRLYLLPGVDYIIKFFFPLYFSTPELLYAKPGQAFVNEYIAGSTFMTLFQLGLIISIIMSSALYIPFIITLWKGTTRFNSGKGKLVWNTSVFAMLQFFYWYVYFRIWLFGHNAVSIGHLGATANYVELSILIIVILGTSFIYLLKMVKLRNVQQKNRQPLHF